MKTRAHFIAARFNRPGRWTSDDVEAARLMANELALPRGDNGQTPDQIWESRAPIGMGQRMRFWKTVEECFEAVKKENKIRNFESLNIVEKESVERQAVARALVSQGYLKLRRRRIPLHVKSILRGKIS